MSAEAGEQGSDDGSDEPQYARKCLLRIFFHRVGPMGVLGDLVLKVKHIDY